MRKATMLAALAFFMANVFAAQPASDTVDKAQQAAQSWLALVDARQYSATWDQAAQPFKAAISKSDWEKAVAGVHAPVGQLERRALTSATYTEHLPGAPAGQYVVIQYQTQFSKKQAAIETIVPMKDADGMWRVSGYFIK